MKIVQNRIKYYVQWPLLIIFLCTILTFASPPWEDYLEEPDAWFCSERGKQILDNILSWQDEYGTWPKNEDTDIVLYSGERNKLRGTFDNRATTGEMRMLARGYRITGDERYKAAFFKGLDLILKAQYPNGGWPQYYPIRKGYYQHITFNDGAMVRLMELLKEIDTLTDYSFVDKDRRAACKQAFEKGVDCILKCQIRVNGKLKVWCAQHDEIDLKPRQARSYELVSLSGGESAGILRLLMNLDNPSPQIIESITAGVEWYRQSQVKGIDVRRVDGKMKAVADPGASPIWGRFCDIETDRPFFCDRDGIPKYDYNQIDQERSTGYAWYGNWGEDVFSDFEKWKMRWGHLLLPAGTKVLLIIGDSTVCQYPDEEARRGWGQFIQSYFKDNLSVINHARSGRSTKTFIAEGLWDNAISIKPTYVLIQFGHNDAHGPDKPESTDANTDFCENLKKYIRDSRKAGAIPILITPMHRRKFDGDGKLKDTLKPYAEVMKKVALETKTPLVDLHTASGELYLKFGPEKTAELSNAANDQTHFNQKGAEMMAALIMEQLPTAEPSLKAYLR